MPSPLSGRFILVAEDNAIIAMDLQMMLEDSGAIVIGPMATTEAALGAVGSAETVDYALLDIDLKGEDSLPVIEALAARGVPMVLITGHDVAARLPQAYASLPVVDKPFSETEILAALERAAGGVPDLAG